MIGNNSRVLLKAASDGPDSGPVRVASATQEERHNFGLEWHLRAVRRLNLKRAMKFISFAFAASVGVFFALISIMDAIKVYLIIT